MLLPISSSDSPIATSVGEGSLDPLAQALPVEHATPARSSAMTNACRSRPGKAMQVVSRKSGAPVP